MYQDIWASMGMRGTAPTISQHDFLWGWLCTNSRCVYMDLGYAQHPDNFTLAPLLDMANHTAVPWLECKVRYDVRGGLELLAPSQPRPDGAGRQGWRKGDEVCITYGAHANTTLLAEYGFVLPSNLHPDDAYYTGNRYNDVLLDEAIIALLDTQGDVGQWKRELLESEGYWAYVAWLTQRLFHPSLPRAGASVAPPTHGPAPRLHGGRRGEAPKDVGHTSGDTYARRR